jgi:hypothetical protein
VEGTRQILAKGSTRLRPGLTYVSFGHPLRPEIGGDARRLAVDLERAVAALADERTTDWWTARKRAATRTTPALTGPEAGAWRRTWALGDRSPATSRPRRRRGRATGWPG